jgi:hypothetical protein
VYRYRAAYRRHVLAPLSPGTWVAAGRDYGLIHRAPGIASPHSPGVLRRVRVACGRTVRPAGAYARRPDSASVCPGCDR